MLISRTARSGLCLRLVYKSRAIFWADFLVYKVDLYTSKYGRFGWTIIGPVCFDKIAPHEPTSEASLNRVMREELPV